MKLTMIGPVYPYRGGIAHFTTLLAEALQGKTVSLQVISFRKQYPDWLFPGKSDRDPSQEALKIPAEFLIDPFNPLTWRNSVQEIARFNPECVVLPWWTTYWATAFWGITHLLRKKGIPVVFLIHNVIPHEARPWDRWLTRKVLENGSGFIVQSPSQADRLKDLLPGARCRLSPHPVYAMFAEQAVSKAAARSRFDLPEGANVALVFGIVRPYKGLRYALEAIAELQQRGREIYLLVAGEFWEDKEITLKQVDEYGIQDRVRIDDRYIPNEEVAWYFSAADLYLASYSGGSQSGAANLALGFGLPIVASTHIAEGLDPGSGEVIGVPASDSQALAAAIERLLLRDETGIAAPPMNRRRFEDFAGELLGFIQGMIRS